MDYNEALDIVRNLKGRYQALEKFDEVLTVAAQAEAAVGDSKRKLEDLGKQIEEKQATIDGLQQELEAIDHEVIESRSIRDSAKADADKAVATARGAMKEKLDEMQEILAKARDEQAEAVGNLNEAYALKKEDLEKEIADLETRRDTILATLQGVKV